MSSYADYLKQKEKKNTQTASAGAAAKPETQTPYEKYLQNKNSKAAGGPTFVSHSTDAHVLSSTTPKSTAPGVSFSTPGDYTNAVSDFVHSSSGTDSFYDSIPEVPQHESSILYQPTLPTAKDLETGLARYGSLAKMSDYASNSKYEPKNVGARVSQEEYYGMSSEKQDEYWDAIEGKPWEDLLYEAVNGNYMALLEINRDKSSGVFDGMDKKYLNTPSELLHLTADEKAIFNYVYKTYGVNSAKSYLNSLATSLSARQRVAIEEAAARQAEKHPVLSSVDTIITSPFRGQIASVGVISDYLEDGKLSENAEYNYLDYQANAIRGKVSDMINNETPLGGVGSFLYNAGMSIGDSAARTVVSFGNPMMSAQLAASSAGASTISNAKDLGLNDYQAFSLGTVAAIAEGFFEKHNLEDLLNADLMKDGKLKYILKNSLNEATEEVSTEAVNTVADIIIAWDKGQMRTAIDAYKAQGLDAKEASIRAFCDKLLEIGASGAAGFLTGGLMSGGKLTSDFVKSAVQNAGSTPLGIVSPGVRDLLNLSMGSKTGTQTDWRADLTALEPAADIQETAPTGISPEDRVLGPWVSSALEYYRQNGKLHPSDAEYILNDSKSQQMLTELTGIEIPQGSDAVRLEAVQKAVSLLAGQSGQQLISDAKNSWYELDNAAGNTAPTTQPTNPMVEELINNLPASATETAPLQSQSRQDLQEIIDAQLSPAQNAPAPIDTAPDSVYDDKNTTGGTTYAEGLQQNDRAGSLGNPAQGVAGIQPGNGPELKGGAQHDQMAVHSGVLRVSDALTDAQQKRGVPTYDVQDVTDDPVRYEQALAAGRNSDPVNGWCVTPKTAQELQEDGVRTFMNEDGTVGAGIAPNGDIVAVFKNKNGGPRKALDTMMPIVIEQGGDRLYCYGEGLVRIYEGYGFTPVARVEFNPEYANDGWVEGMDTPYIYFMVHNGDSAAQVALNAHNYPNATQEQLDALPTYGKDDYDAAMAYRDSLLDDSPTDLTTPPPSAPTDIGPAMPHAPGGSKVSKLHSNTYANATGEAVRGIGQWAQELDPNIARYDPVTEKQTFDEAISRANSPEARSAEIEKLLSKDGWTAADNDTAYLILDKLRQEGDAVNYAALANKQRQMNTAGGQLIQSNAKYTRENLTKRTVDAFNALSDLTERDVPKKFWKDKGFETWKQEVGTAVLDISNKLEQAAENGSAEDVKQIVRSLANFRRTTAWFGISSNLTKVAEKGLNSLDADTAKAIAMAQLSQIPQDFRKRTPGEVMETIRVYNMLASLTTMGRNLFGNGVVGLVDATSDSTTGRWADILLSKVTGKRTVGNDLTHGKTYLDAAAKAASIAALCVELDIPMDSDSRFTEGSTRTFSPQGGPVTRLLGAYEKAMKYGLEVTDQFFSGGTAGAVDLSLQKLGDKAHLTDTERAEISSQAGLRRTFKEDRMLSHAATGVKQGLNKIGKGHIGLGNAVMPFARTGSNVTQTGADYTGAGLAIGIKETIQLVRDVKNGVYKNGEKIIYGKDGKTVKQRVSLTQAQRRAATNIGRGITGIGTVALFTTAALCGVLKVHNDEDKDAKALDQSGNLSGAQLNLSALLRGITGESTDWQTDDCVISMDFLEPFNSQMYLGYALSQEQDLGQMLGAYPGATMNSLWQSVLDMPMMQGLSDVVDLGKSDDTTDAMGQLLGNQATGFIPSWMRQTAQWVDPYYRDTTGDNVWEKTGNQIVSRIPFLSQTLPKKVDGLGREQLRHDGDFMGFMNTFVNPGQVEQIETGELESFIDGVAQSSGNLEVYPRSTLPNQLTYKDENGEYHTYPLTGHDRETYQKAYGETVTRVYTDLMNMEYFATMSAEDQATVMKNALSYAAQTAESAVADWHEEPKYIANRPEGMSEAEAILRNAIFGSSTTYAGLPISTAVYVDTLVDAIIPETKSDGTAYSSARTIQKLEAVVADDSLEAYADALLREYLDDSQEKRYDAALDAGFTADEYVEAYRQFLDATGDGKKKSVIRYIQREMGMSYIEAKRLYEIYSKPLEEQ